MALRTYGLINEVFLVGDDIDRQLFARFSLTVRQFHLLNWLAMRNECGLSELADFLLCDKSNVTGIVRRLVAAGLIEKVSNADRRYTKVRLTALGRQVHHEAESALRDSIEARFMNVPESEHEALQGLLARMHAQLYAFLSADDAPATSPISVSSVARE